jgi:hypothetical protein
MNQPALFNLPQTTRTSDDYWTPQWLFDAMGLRFDLDVACPEGGAPWVPADRYYTQADDGLTAPWYGRVWMNPPYSNASPWVHRLLDYGNGIALTVFAKSKWQDRLWNDSAVGIVNLPQHFRFEQGRIPWPNILWAIGDDNIAAIGRIGRVR